MEDQEFVPTKEQVEAALADTDQTDDTLSVLSSEERQVAAPFLSRLVTRIRQQAQADSAKELSAKVQEMAAQNKRLMEAEVEKFRQSLKPPDPKQLEELLSQDYGEMTIRLNPRKGGEQTFTIRELPQASEKKMLGIISKRILPHLKELAAIEWTASATAAEKLQKVIDILPEGLDTLAECCAIALDPYEDDGINMEWVQKNMSSARIMHVIEAQFEVSRIRDFGSAVYRLLPR